ncbi:MAG: PLP-dependent aminotransferase family protein [Candidatus Promineifilaceae bacterium]
MSLVLDPDSPVPLYRQLYDQLRIMILDGRIEPGFRLPPSRRIAADHQIARVTVTTAYEQLQAEGFVTSRVGAGTFVSDLPELFPRQVDSAGKYTASLSTWGQRVLEIGVSDERGIPAGRRTIDFGFGRSFPHIFPYDVWRRLLARYLSTDDTMLSHYGSVAGYYPLRQAVAGYLSRLRGVRCSADQVIIVSGMQQALDLLARLLLNSGDEVLVETPGYSGAFELFRTFGARLRALPVDVDGFPVEQIPVSSQARLAFVTPSNQFPRGGTMPLTRRLSLLRWAREANALILEDDYDGELRYTGHPISALQGLDRDERVVYLGTFSKVLFPALRLGYVVLPLSLANPFHQAMNLVDRGAPTLTQAAVTDFINEGHFERHLRRLRSEYGRRRRSLVEAIERYLGDGVSYSQVEAGLHVMLYLPSVVDEKVLVNEAAYAGVGVYPGEPYHLDRPAPPSILLGFSGLNTDEIVEGVNRLASVVHSQMQKSE